MSRIDVIKENGKFEQLLRVANSNSLLKDEYLIPDTHPDVQEILFVESKATITSKALVGEKYLLEGRVDYTVLYLAREEASVVNSVNYSQKFTNYLDLVEGEHRVEFEAECKIEHIDSKIMNERKISVESVINIDWELYKSTEFEFVKDIEGSEKVEVLKKTESISRVAADESIDLNGKTMVRVGMDKPQIEKILSCTTNLHKKEIKLLEDKIYVACYCKINLLYSSLEGRDIVSLTDDIYLSREVEAKGINQEMLSNMTFELVNKEITLGDDDLGEVRIVNIEVSAKSNIKVFSKENIDVVRDAYSPKFLMDLKKDKYEVGGIQGSQSGEIIVKETLNQKENEAKPEQILCAVATAMIINSSVVDDKVVSDGIVKVDVLYKTQDEDKLIAHKQEEIVFKSSIDVIGSKSGMKPIVKSNIENVDTSIEGNNIAVKVNIMVIAKVFFEVSKEFISDVLEIDGDSTKKKASITIYVVDKDDTLWNLAKKYNTTMEEIMKMNDMEQDEKLEIGTKLLIPGRAIF